jgi:hypothetical protein
MNKRAFLILALALAGLPAFADLAIDGDLVYEYTVQPGQRVEGLITVINAGKAAAEARVYQTDYSFKADGTSDYGQPGSLARSNAAWISLAPKALAVPAGQRAPVSFSMQVPADPGLYGSYWSMIMVEELNPAGADPKSKMSVIQVVRYGIQVVATIGSTGVVTLGFQNARLYKDGKADVFSVDVENRGDRMVKPLVSLELYDNKGKSPLKLDSGLFKVYPGTSYRYKFTLPDSLPRALYKAMVFADCGDNQVFAANVNLNLQR